MQPKKERNRKHPFFNYYYFLIGLVGGGYFSSSSSTRHNYGCVWIHWKLRLRLRLVFVFVCFFFFFSRVLENAVTVQWTVRLFNHEQYICALFTEPQISLFSNFFIKNGFHGTIHTFKNYFTIMFSVFSFQFQQNKFYPNRPLNRLQFPFMPHSQ